MTTETFATELHHQISLAEAYRLSALQDGDRDTAELALARIADLVEIADRNGLPRTESAPRERALAAAG